MCVDVEETSSSNCLHLMSEVDSSVSEHVVKVRKPYIITKQRERWTEEEHNKFLEALKLYGRAWRRIEEHIGSKTTVQIRSHAQKFFSKVMRETSNDRAGTVKSVEIPPPRPKRKPSHPYPRKFGRLSCKKASFVEEQMWSFIEKQSPSKQESKSPTSVLTAFGSDTIGTTAFDTLKHCMSPVSSADRTVTVEEILSEQGNGSKFSSTSAVYKGNQSTDPSIMELDLDIQDPVNFKDPSTTQQIITLKLFGSTVTVSGFQLHKNQLEYQESLSDSNKIDIETQKFQEQDKSEAILGEGRGESNPFYGGISQMACSFPSVELNMVSSSSRFTLYEGSPFGFSRHPSTRFDQSQLHRTDDKFVNNDSTLKESCETDSSTSSCNNSGNADKNCCEGVVQMEESLPQSSVLKPSKNSFFSSMRPSSANSSRGFMPYKRCG